MSPSESDLRAALHDGEGDAPQTDLLIMTAQNRAAQRRTRLLSTAVIVGLVAAAGVGGAVISRNSGGSGRQSHTNSAAGAGATGPAAANAPAPVQGALAGGTNGRSAAGVGCSLASSRTGPPALSASRSSATMMFSKNVSSVVVCAYDRMSIASTQQRTADRPQLVLSGKQASTLIQSLKAAPTTRPRAMCPMLRMQSRSIAMIALSRAGNVLGIARTDLGVPVCNSVTIEGGATRYNWTPPAVLAPKLARLAPVALAPSAPPTR